MRTITAECVICAAPFTYRSAGGRRRKLCDKGECHTARNTFNKTTERKRAKPRVNGYVARDYPITVQSGLPPQDELSDMKELTAWSRDRRALRKNPSGLHDAGIGHTGRRSGSSYSEILQAGQGYYIDDVRKPLVDKAPLRYIPPALQAGVKDWYSRAAFPLAGYAGTGPKGAEEFWFVRGSLETRPYCPPRVTRRFCAEHALVPLEAFVRSL